MDRKIIVTFVKRTNLMEFCKTDKHHENEFSAPEQYYAREQDVRLVVTERITSDGHIFVHINCPINPLPVKGEFEIPNWGVLNHFLTSQGWKQREVITGNFF